MRSIDETLRVCFLNMRASTDFSDDVTLNSFKELLSCIISNPSTIVNNRGLEEKLSIALTSILTSDFPKLCPSLQGIDVRNLTFATAYYLFMHQLETGYFYDRNWPAFITLLHYGRDEFAKFIVHTNPFAPERIARISGRPVEAGRARNAAKGFEANMMLVARNKGFWDNDLNPWWDDLYDDMHELLDSDPFHKEALPLYEVITGYLKENDVTFVNNIDRI